MITGRCDTRQVFIGGIELTPERSQGLYNHSPDGFAWGYSGSGPAQLALAILLHFENDDWALANYQAFKHEVIAGIDQNANFSLPEKQIKDWIKEHKS